MGNRLREVRKQQGLSQFELARICGIETANLSKVENGILRPYPGWRQRIAQALGVSEDEIFPAEVKKEEEVFLVEVKKMQATIPSKTAAEYLGISYWLLLQMCKAGQIPHFRAGGRILFRREALDLWMSEQEAASITKKEPDHNGIRPLR